jgi:UDPglucose 6-dehydrogenase
MSVIGCGHLGATHAACMASLGHEVIGVDIDEGKVSLLNSGKGWFHEPDLDPMLAETIEAGRLRFTTDFAEAAEFADVHFIGVATPGHADGSYDMSQLRAVVNSLVPHLRGDCLIIGKSTVTPGTAASLQTLADGLLRPGQGRVEVAWNPEFLREGCAVADTLRPDRIVVGTVTEAAAETIREIYRPQTDAGIPLVLTDLATSELAKGAANAFLATKISFINAMADICAATGGDITALAHSLGLDPRIGRAFLRAGLGYGGACLPKDVRGLGTFAAEVGARNAGALLGAVDAINAARMAQTVDLAEDAVGGAAGKRVAVWGASFKAGTDDVRDSAGLLVADKLRSLGATVTVYDPMGGGNALVTFPELAYADSASSAAAAADVVVVVTAWPEFAQASPAAVGGVVARMVVIDSCQGIAVRAWRQAGWNVFSLTGTGAGQFLEHATSGPLEMPVRPASRPRAPSGHDRH